MSSRTEKKLPLREVVGIAVLVFGGLMIAMAVPSMRPIVLIVWGLGFVFRLPAFGLLFAAGWGAYRYGTGIYAAPAIVALAWWEMARRQKRLFNRLDYLRLAGTAGVMLVVSLMLSGLSYSADVDGHGIWQGGGAGDSAGSTDGYASGFAQVDPDEYRASNPTSGSFNDGGVLSGDGTGLGLTAGEGGGLFDGTSETEGGIWDLTKWVVLGVAMVIVVAWWAHLQPTKDEVVAARRPDPAELVRRLEALGVEFGRVRLDHETVLAYTERLSILAEDQRFRDVGKMVSAIVYGDDELAARDVESVLGSIEATYRQPVS